MISSVAVIGTVFVDCKGFAKQNYRPTTRNLGSIQFVHGGVGRNVAENLAMLDLPVSLVSSVDGSSIGKEVTEKLRKVKVDTGFLTVTEQGMGMWLAILDEKGDLAGSISQMPDLAKLEEWIDKEGPQAFRGFSHIVLEVDLNDRLTKKVLSLAKAHQLPVYGIPGNLDVVLNDKDILKELTCFICNHHEAELLFNKKFADLEDMKKELILFADRMGLRYMVITLAEKGAIYYDAVTKEAGHQPAFPVKLVDSSGAGDAFFSGTVMGLIRQLPLKHAVICGTKVAGWTIESTENTCADLPQKIKADPFFQSVLVHRVES